MSTAKDEGRSTSGKYRPLARGDACQICKQRKVRCPGERPACSRCVRLNKTCVYLTSSDPTTSSSTSPPKDGSSETNDNSGQVPTTASSSSALQDLSSLEEILHSLTTSPLSAATSSTNESQSVPGSAIPLGFIPQVSHDAPLLPPEWNWGWNTVDLPQLMGQNEDNEAQLTEDDRTHLLLLYFSNFRLYGMQVHFSTLYANLHSAIPSERPHPCLLYAMYLVSCSSSPLPHIQAKEDMFYRLALQSLDNAISLDVAMRDEGGIRIYDAIRAATLISLWHFYKHEVLRGWMMLGQATRLAVAAGLHKMPSSTSFPEGGWPQRQWNRRVRNAFYESPVPKSRTELGEQIHAFWCLFVLDRCAATALHWDAAFDLDSITTPLPRSWAEYETDGGHGGECNETLASFLLAEPYESCGQDHRTEYVHLIKAIVLCHAAATGQPHDPKIKNALDRFTADLDPQWKEPMIDDTGIKVVSAATASLQFIILTAEMYCKGANLRAWSSPEVLEVVQRMFGVLTLLKDTNLGDIGLFTVTIWIRMGRILMIESKRLEREGQAFAAASLANDISFIIDVLRPIRQIMVQSSVLEMIEWTTQSPDEFFEKEAIVYQTPESA